MDTPRHAALPGFRENRILQGLTALFALVWLWGALAPLDRFDWFLENLLVFVAVAALCAGYGRYRLSTLSYALIALFLALHTVGAHYTYAKVPAGFWLQDALAQERNHFDRLIHCGFGVLIACPIREMLVRHGGAGLRLSAFTAFAAIAGASGLFEIAEWIVAILVDPAAAMAYLGTQGDVFDAQKDSALAVGGGLLGLLATRRFFRA